jgi:CysZ protein
MVIYHYYQDIFFMLWEKPASVWLTWLWHLASWIFGVFLLAVATMIAYMAGQIIFSVWIMDQMAQITERLVTGHVHRPISSSVIIQLFHLIRQEIPRTVFPVLVSTLLMILGWFTPLGPLLTLASPAVMAVFLAWDNTDLVAARKQIPFQQRWRFLKQHLSFHLGFGLWFLIPFANIVFLSFAPVGAMLFLIEKHTLSQMSSGQTRD